MFMVLAPELDLERFFVDLVRVPKRLLLLDYDGCLAPFRTDRARALPYPGVVERLARLQASGATRVVVVSGRRADELPALLGLQHPPEIWGSHGVERRFADGRRVDRAIAAPQRHALDAAERALRAHGLGEMLERKPGSLAVHWRGIPSQTVLVIEREVRQVHAEVATPALELHAFEGGMELRAPGIHKGGVVARLLAETRGPVAVAYLGDDRTDEDAFAAVPAQGLPVLVREELRQTRAKVWLRPPAELLAFLDLWLAATVDDRGGAPAS